MDSPKKITKLVRNLVSKYINEDCIYGKNDCNLMIMDLYEPDYFKKLVGSYTTVPGGYRSSIKITGYPIVKDILKHSNKYAKIPISAISVGDIGCCLDTHSCILILGRDFFAPITINNEEKYRISNIRNINKNNYIFYRRLDV